jgi:hypothetical protein
VVSGLVSEKTGCSENLFQTFAAIETIEVTLDSGLLVICANPLRKLDENLWFLGSGRKAVKHRRPSRSAPGLSRKELDGMGCGCRRDEGQGRKTDVARGGWAEDARLPPATSFVFVVIPASQGDRQRAFGERTISSSGWMGRRGLGRFSHQENTQSISFP